MRAFRPLIGLLALMTIGRAALQADFARFLFLPHSALRGMHRDADAGLPQYSRFLVRVAQSTPRTSTIRLILPADRQQHRISGDPLMRRAKYLLAGRTVSDSQSATDYIALWNSAGQTPGYQRLWTGEGGELRRRTR